MRLWTVHPQYLDAKGLVALWREALLAQAVLRGQTRGYTQHPQLFRFRQQADALAAIGSYLGVVQEEAVRRGYRFDPAKINPARVEVTLTEHDGQLAYEWQHLLGKLEVRDPARYQAHRLLGEIAPHPLFHLVPGPVQAWEKQG